MVSINSVGWMIAGISFPESLEAFHAFFPSFLSTDETRVMFNQELQDLLRRQVVDLCLRTIFEFNSEHINLNLPRYPQPPHEPVSSSSNISSPNRLGGLSKLLKGTLSHVFTCCGWDLSKVRLAGAQRIELWGNVSSLMSGNGTLGMPLHQQWLHHTLPLEAFSSEVHFHLA